MRRNSGASADKTSEGSRVINKHGRTGCLVSDGSFERRLRPLHIVSNGVHVRACGHEQANTFRTRKYRGRVKGRQAWRIGTLRYESSIGKCGAGLEPRLLARSARQISVIERLARAAPADLAATVFASKKRGKPAS